MLMSFILGTIACVAYFRNGALLKFTIESTHAEEDVKFVLCAASTMEYRDPNTNELTGVQGIKAEIIGQMCYANGAPVTGWIGEFYGSGGGDTMGAFPTRDWYNFVTVQTTVDLQKGTNTIEFRGTTVRLNWDYIELTTKTAELSMEVIDDEGGSIGGW